MEEGGRSASPAPHLIRAFLQSLGWAVHGLTPMPISICSRHMLSALPCLQSAIWSNLESPFCLQSGHFRPSPWHRVSPWLWVAARPLEATARVKQLLPVLVPSLNTLASGKSPNSRLTLPSILNKAIQKVKWNRKCENLSCVKSE